MNRRGSRHGAPTPHGMDNRAAPRPGQLLGPEAEPSSVRPAVDATRRVAGYQSAAVSRLRSSSVTSQARAKDQSLWTVRSDTPSATAICSTVALA